MNLEDQWYPSAQLIGIASLPETKRGINKRARSNNWKPKRRRRGRGGGWEYHISALPENVQAAILFKTRSNPVEDTLNPLKISVSSLKPSSGKRKYSPELLWHIYSQKSNTLKEVARQRLQIVQAVQSLVASGERKGAAKRMVSAQTGISTSTIGRYLKAVKGFHKSDWLAVLVSKYTGRNDYAEISREAWDYFKADYLRLEKPASQAVYERTLRVSASRGWIIPSLKTIMRKINREIPIQVLILAREGMEALNRFYPSQQRDHSAFHALEAVNADGHKFDVFVKFPDGEICRPVMVAWQDVYSAKILSYRVSKTENTDSVRLSYGDMVECFGIPEQAYLDNGRGFASKWMTGGTPNRYRFKVKREDPTGIMTHMGVSVHWCTPYHGQSKPIERAFLDLSEYISKHPLLGGTYTGRNPNAKPENYGSKAVPLSIFLKVLEQEIIAHNARKGRRSPICSGKSFDEVFKASYETSTISKATPEQRRLWLLAAESVTASRQDGSITFLKNRYYCDELAEYAGSKVVARFDPDNLHGSIHVETMDGAYIGKADCVQAAGFNDSQTAREHNRKRNQWKKAAKKQLEVERSMSAIEAANMLPNIEPPETPASGIVQPSFKKAVGQDFDTEAKERMERNFAENLRRIKEERYFQ